MFRTVLPSRRTVYKCSVLSCLLGLCFVIYLYRETLENVAMSAPLGFKRLMGSPTSTIQQQSLEVVFPADHTGSTNLTKRFKLPPRAFMSRQLTVDLIYEPCTQIPSPPKNVAYMTSWPEEAYIHDPKIINIREIADPTKSRVWIDGKPEVRVGDEIPVHLELFDGFGKKKTTGGDLVRVWMREPALEASTSARVRDNQDGTYSAILTAFWVGRPKVKAAIISPREVIATQFRRRYICPQVLMNTGVFEHPYDRSKKEETPCSFDPQIPAYPVICNLTSLNDGSPWYCGKPRISGLECRHWTRTSDRKLLDSGHEQQLLTNIEREFMSVKYKAMLIPTKNLVVTVSTDTQQPNVTRVLEDTKCHVASKALSWPRSRTSGYLYNRKWTNRHCYGEVDQSAMRSCLQNTRVVLIGDSTVRQLFFVLMRKMPCTLLTPANITDTHLRNSVEGMCLNKQLNATVELKKHVLPMCVPNPLPKSYFRSFEANLNLIKENEMTIVLLHVSAHIVNSHTHVYYEILQSMKRGILKLLQRVPSVTIAIKGPAAFSFAKDSAFTIWKPDVYADIYQQMLSETFRDLQDRIVFLDCLDITVSTEQTHIHPEDFVNEALVETLLSHVCPH